MVHSLDTAADRVKSKEWMVSSKGVDYERGDSCRIKKEEEEVKEKRVERMKATREHAILYSTVGRFASRALSLPTALLQSHILSRSFFSPFEEEEGGNG